MATQRDIIGTATALRHYVLAAIAEDAPPEERERAKAIAEVALRLVEFALVDLNRIADAAEAIAAKAAPVAGVSGT